MQTTNIASLIIAAILFGLSNGLSPGPSLTLVISKTLQHDLKAGIKVACGPIIYGLIIIPISVCFSFAASHFKFLIGIISIFGSIYIGYLGFKQLLFKKIKFDFSIKNDDAFKVGVIANFCSPYAYAFWFTVGAPLIVNTGDSLLATSILFGGVYYACLVGSKIMVAIFVEKSRSIVEKFYNHVMHALGIILLLFACLILKDGISFLIS